nr:creatininase family protein [Novacetimonas hansenii]
MKIRARTPPWGITCARMQSHAVWHLPRGHVASEPTSRPSCRGADYFGSVIGGIALGQATLRAVLTDIMSCLLRNGLTRVIIFNGHGGNAQAVHDVTLSMRHTHGVVIPSVYLWSIAAGMLPEVMGNRDVAERSAGHGGNPLSSVAMALFPDLVRPDLLPAPATHPQQFMGLPVNGFATARFEGSSIHISP